MIQALKLIKKKFSRTFFDVKYKNIFKGEEFDVRFRCDNAENFHFGKSCYIGPACHFDALGGIYLDDYVIIGPHVCIWSYNHDFKHEMIPYGPDNDLRPVKIGKGAWIGLRTIILPGSEIGEGSVVGAGSIVGGKIPPFSIVRPNRSEHSPLNVLKNSNLYYRGKN